MPSFYRLQSSYKHWDPESQYAQAGTIYPYIGLFIPGRWVDSLKFEIGVQSIQEVPNFQIPFWTNFLEKRKFLLENYNISISKTNSLERQTGTIFVYFMFHPCVKTKLHFDLKTLENCISTRSFSKSLNCTNPMCSFSGSIFLHRFIANIINQFFRIKDAFKFCHPIGLPSLRFYLSKFFWIDPRILAHPAENHNMLIKNIISNWDIFGPCIRAMKILLDHELFKFQTIYNFDQLFLKHISLRETALIHIKLAGIKSHRQIRTGLQTWENSLTHRYGNWVVPDTYRDAYMLEFTQCPFSVMARILQENNIHCVLTESNSIQDFSQTFVLE